MPSACSSAHSKPGSHYRFKPSESQPVERLQNHAIARPGFQTKGIEGRHRVGGDTLIRAASAVGRELRISLKRSARV
jgi:hypothetical protein